ncbi:MAG TPA: 2-C-methyl-D-erythritol 2,4-cyclodiphosphate synthase [Opitutaceae bacterium]|jgi:2-C-methyl-D-erythritol 2,4-cyclodiphosphate synthase|nr:2-C-methyl-D-erythritol 2,4-cyclodiphosphate synthase [Opitutaceae bacterium]
MPYRIGHGYDIHRLVAGRPLVLGGVKFDTDYGLDGHSDADCVTHAICDALLGAVGLPDIGHFFPTTDPAYQNMNSQLLLQQVVAELRRRGWAPVNIDATVIAEKPRILPRLGEMKLVLANSTGLLVEAVGLKATTNEGVDDLGRGLAIAAHAVALIQKI